MEFISKLEGATLEQAFDLVKERLSVMAISKLEQLPQVSEIKTLDLPPLDDSIALVSEFHKAAINTSVMQSTKGLQVKEFKVR